MTLSYANNGKRILILRDWERVACLYLTPVKYRLVLFAPDERTVLETHGFNTIERGLTYAARRLGHVYKR